MQSNILIWGLAQSGLSKVTQLKHWNISTANNKTITSVISNPDEQFLVFMPNSIYALISNAQTQDWNI